MRLLIASSASALLLACASARYSSEPGAPTLVMPGHFMEGSGEPGASAKPPASAVPSAAAAAQSAAAPGSSAVAGPAAPALAPSKAPDPTPLRQAEQVEYDLELSEGKVRVVSVKPVTLKEPIVTPRRMGRWAIELSIGPELIERLRFDFPGTAADEPVQGPKKLAAPLDMGSRAIARVKLLVPQSPRVRRALLIDRALNTVAELEWPLPAPQ